MEDLMLCNNKASLPSKKEVHQFQSYSLYGPSEQDTYRTYKREQGHEACTWAQPSCGYKSHYHSPQKRDKDFHIYNVRMRTTATTDCIQCNSLYQHQVDHCQQNQQQTVTEQHMVTTSSSHSWYLLPLLLLMLLPDVDGGRRTNLILGVGSSPGPDTTTLLGPYEDKTVYPDPSHMFSQPNNTEIRTQVGATAVLHCHPHNVGENTVSWIRRRDFHLLTVGGSSYSSDMRFHVMYIKDDHDWQLHIRYVQVRDGGSYECQVSSHPPVSLFTNIQVLEATSEILGGPEKFMTAGTSLRLVCVLRQNTEEPSYVFWYHRDNMINYDTSREVKVENNGGLSVLFLSNVRPEDSGNYTCSPDNAQPSHINIQVLRGGETPAAIHSGAAAFWHSSRSGWLMMILVMAMLFWDLGSCYINVRRAAPSASSEEERFYTGDIQRSYRGHQYTA